MVKDFGVVIQGAVSCFSSTTRSVCSIEIQRTKKNITLNEGLTKDAESLWLINFTGLSGNRYRKFSLKKKLAVLLGLPDMPKKYFTCPLFISHGSRV